MVFRHPIIAKNKEEDARFDYFSSLNKQFNSDGTQNYSDAFSTERAATPDPFVTDANGNTVFNNFIALDAKTQPAAGPLAQRQFPIFANRMAWDNFDKGSKRINEVQEQGQKLIVDMLNGYKERIG